MKVSYEIYVLPGDDPDFVSPVEEHESNDFVGFAETLMDGLGVSDKPVGDESARRVEVAVQAIGSPFVFGPLWFDTAMMHTLQSGLTFKHQQLAGKQGREGTTNAQEMKDHGVL